jgi:sulfotransferase family protein
MTELGKNWAMRPPVHRIVDRLRVTSARGKGATGVTPVVILGTGGSGTRVLATLACEAGYFMGTNLNRPGDSSDLGQFTGRWANRYLRKSNWIDEMWRGSNRRGFGFPRAMAVDFRESIEEHRAAIEHPEARWGWKAPRTILILPFLFEMFRAAKVVHLVRDGRDIAYSRNQNQLRQHGHRVLPPSEKRVPRAQASIMFWARVNLAAARYGAQFLGGSYLLLRYEDICSDPGEAAIQLVDFLASPVPRESMRSAGIEVVDPSDSLGRWRDREPGKTKALERLGGDALREFGYL